MKTNVYLMLLSMAVVWGVYHQVTADDVLVIHPVYAGSHILALRRVLEELMERGHKVTVVRWEESSKISAMDSENYRELVLAVDNRDGRVPFMTHKERAVFEFPDALLWKRGLWPTNVFEGGMSSVAAACDTMFLNESLFTELKKIPFKIAIVDLIFNECGLALAHHLNLPVVAYWALSFISGETQYSSAFNTPASIPHMYLPFTDRMNFLERSVNFYYGVCSHLVMQIHFWYTNYYIQKHLPDVPHPSVLISNMSGVLINSHWVFDYPKQLPPTFLQVGGFHIRKPKPTLPKEFQEIFDKSKNGVILFALGKNFDSKSLPPKVYQAYFNAFAALNQSVIVKSNSSPEKIPPNVKVFSYIPQVDILAQSKTVAFVTHCGLHGVMEAIYFGVKMVTIPIFFDQGNVAVRLTDLGVAVGLSKSSGEAEISAALKEVLENPRYEKNIKRISRMYHSSLEKPLEISLWLIEHVMEYGGADHLKLSSKDLNFVQYFCLDVIFLFLVIIAIQMFLAVKFFVFIKRKLVCGASVKQKET